VSLRIAGYCRISVDEELDRDNTSIENQKTIITEYVVKHFPNAELSLYEDRDRSGYSFEQREGYQKMRKHLMNGDYKILIIKDFSRFARRNSKGLVELEDLRDAGVRIISIGDVIDYPTQDDWMAIQFRFLINEMPVTDASKKVKAVIKSRQEKGQWICNVPYGYVMEDTKKMTFKISQPEADTVKEIYQMYLKGYGFKKISNILADQHIPTPRAAFVQRKEQEGEECKFSYKHTWSIKTVSDILTNDFYIGTLRQGKCKRAKINGKQKKVDEAEHIVFENHHEPIIDNRTFASVQEQIALRAKSYYRGTKKYPNIYTGFLVCGDCGSTMVSMSRGDIAPAYICRAYNQFGLKACTSHHIRVDFLNSLLKRYLMKVRDNASDVLHALEIKLASEKSDIQGNTDTAELIQKQIEKCHDEMKQYVKMKAYEMMKDPDQAKILCDTYDDMIADLAKRIVGLENQLKLVADKRNAVIQANRTAKTVIDIFDRICEKKEFDKDDLSLMIEKIYVHNDHINIHLKSDIDALLNLKEEDGVVNFNFDTAKNAYTVTLKTTHQRAKVYSVNVVSIGDPLEIFTERDELMLKKYSPIASLEKFSDSTAKSLNDVTGHLAVICDTDEVVCAYGSGKREVAGKNISQSLDKIMRERKSYVANLAEGGDVVPICDGEETSVTAQIIVPIVTNGDCLGAVALISFDDGAKMEANACKLAQLSANIIANQFE
jgi:stage V sporulation protein T